MLESSGYSSSAPSGSGGSEESTKQKTGYWGLTKLKRAYADYLGNKRDEIEEQKSSRRYRHGAHWTDEQIKVLNRRKQPVVTYNRIGRKIDGIVGLVEKLRLDPKAYPRTPQHQQGADLATAALRYVFDEANFKFKSSQCAEDAGIDGIAGIELEMIHGDQGDPEIALNVVEPDGFFYDPRSFQLDFSDALYMGQGKWVDRDVAEEQFGEEITDSGDTDLTTNSDRDNKWFFTVGGRKMIRLVDIWYKHKDKWCWALFTGHQVLQEGDSPFKDQKNKPICKFVMFSAAVDHDGDRYGFVRNLKSVNDEINMRRSKALHELNSRRIKATKGAFDDLEKVRLEASRPDGILLINPGTELEFDDQAKQVVIAGQMEMLKEAKAEIENFGPNPAILGDSGIKNQSGRAIQLLQQAGIAELGPYFSAYRDWKIRLYRAVWNVLQRFWTAERWIRVTDDKGLMQYVQLNGLQIDPQTGMPGIVNHLGSLDVDIILDEGPDTVTMMSDVYETLGDIVPSIAKFVPPAVATALVSILVQNSPLPEEAKKQLREAAQAPPPPSPEIQKLEAEKQMKAAELEHDKAKAQQDGVLELQKAQGQMMIKREEMEATIQLKREESAATIEIEREKASNQMELEREKMMQAADKTKAEMVLKSHSHVHDVAMSKEKMGMEKEKASQVSRAAQPQSAVMVDALKQISQPRDSEKELVKVLSSLAGEIKNMNRPKNKKVRKNQDGTFDILGS